MCLEPRFSRQLRNKKMMKRSQASGGLQPQVSEHTYLCIG